MSHTWQSILSGGIVAMFAFSLAMAWDVLRSRREQKQRDDAVLTFAKTEIDALLGIVQNNQKLVERELQLLRNKNKLLQNPLDTVDSGFWDIVKVQTPQVLLRDAETLSKIRDVSRRTDQVAQMIRSRESFRAANQALSSFAEQMMKYDQLLQTFQPELIEALKGLKALLEAAERRL